MRMNLLETFISEDISLNIYSEKRKEFYATTEQLAIALGYKTVNGVHKLINKNPKLKNDKFSRLVDAKELKDFATSQTGNTQKVRKVRVFCKRGIIELARFSKTDKAEQFFDKLLDRMEWLENQLHLATVRHVKSIPTQNKLHQAIKESPVYCEYEGQRLRNAFTNFNNLINKTACLGVNKPKESMTAEELKRLEHIEHLVIYLLGEGKNYGQIKAELLPSKEEKGA